MYSLFVIIFLIVSALSKGDYKIGFLIATALFGIADAICYLANVLRRK